MSGSRGKVCVMRINVFIVHKLQVHRYFVFILCDGNAWAKFEEYICQLPNCHDSSKAVFSTVNNSRKMGPLIRSIKEHGIKQHIHDEE